MTGIQTLYSLFLVKLLRFAGFILDAKNSTSKKPLKSNREAVMYEVHNNPNNCNGFGNSATFILKH
jgi:hypothetical protein